MKKTLSLGLGILALAGCVSVLPEPVVPDALYRLNASAYEPSGEPVKLDYSVTVFEPEGSNLLLGKGIVYESNSGGLSLYKSVQWSDSSSIQLQSLLLDRLAHRTPDSDGMALSDRSAAFTPVEVRWQMRDFVVRDDEAVVSARVTIMTGRKRDVLAQFDVTEVQSYSGKPKEDGVLALIDASHQLVDEIALRLPPIINQSELIAESSRR